MKLDEIFRISGQIKCVTGLHIAASNSDLHIGGIDSPVVKNPITLEPYIPGSSLKGKIRSLLEWEAGIHKQNPFDLGTYSKATETEKQKVLRILQLFGVTADKPRDENPIIEKIGPSRLSFWDCNLNSEWLMMARDTGSLLTEDKSENSINRLTSVAGNPRHIERVPAGSIFDFTLSFRLFNNDNEGNENIELLKTVYKGMKLLELDSLGGSGTRGYGKIKFENIQNDSHFTQMKSLSYESIEI